MERHFSLLDFYHVSEPFRPSKQGSFAHLFRKVSSHGSVSSSSDLSRSVQSLGFGKIYFGSSGRQAGTMTTIPLVTENSLHHDDHGLTYDNGAFMVMESMLWNKVTKVTVKRLHKDPPKGGEVDLLINENECIGQLRHPNILLLMGICQTENLNGIVLLYERINFGSLYHYMHERTEHLSHHGALEILTQICDAIMYIHQQNFLHCSLTSHAIQLVSSHLAKLGNFDYMVEQCDEPYYQKKSHVVENIYPNAVYNWMAPELMKGEPPSEQSDMYSFCAVMWEVFMGILPWGSSDAEHIKREVLENRNSLPLYVDKLSQPFDSILEGGLQLEPSDRRLAFEGNERRLTFEVMRDLLSTVPQMRRANVPNIPNKVVPQRIKTKNQHMDVSTSEDDAPAARHQQRMRKTPSPPRHRRGAPKVEAVNARLINEDDSVFEENGNKLETRQTREEYEFIQNEKKRAFFEGRQQQQSTSVRSKSEPDEGTRYRLIQNHQPRERTQSQKPPSPTAVTSPRDNKAEKRLTKDVYTDLSAVPTRPSRIRDNPFTKPPPAPRNTNGNNSVSNSDQTYRARPYSRSISADTSAKVNGKTSPVEDHPLNTSLQSTKSFTSQTSRKSGAMSPRSNKSWLNNSHNESLSFKPANHRISYAPEQEPGTSTSKGDIGRYMGSNSDIVNNRPSLNRSSSVDSQMGGIKRFRSETFLNLCGASYNDRRPKTVTSNYKSTENLPASSSSSVSSVRQMHENNPVVTSPYSRRTRNQWFAGKGSIKGLISTFEEHEDEQGHDKQPDTQNRRAFERQTSLPEKALQSTSAFVKYQPKTVEVKTVTVDQPQTKLPSNRFSSVSSGLVERGRGPNDRNSFENGASQPMDDISAFADPINYKRVYVSGNGDDILFIPSRTGPTVVNGDYSGTDTDSELRSFDNNEPHEYYFDDDLNSNAAEDTQWGLQGDLQGARTSSFQPRKPYNIGLQKMPTTSGKIPSNSYAASRDAQTYPKVSPDKGHGEARSTERMEKVVTMTRDMRIVAPKNPEEEPETEADYMTTVKVDSSPNDGGTHVITHLRTNVKTGETVVLSERTFKASKAKTHVLFDA
ncbi:uncharacterized protein LOC106160837 [Lingula anatina]|uniref:Uncharacterized protein LOC106160837 n=1 Tax=Lingula anatina TaxID=7574 RepID=A0A1S3I466_LINAN|nr:uncharacterized protein LOC106160837 [Lingula anatina]|eukprot:XP_013393057.1 uncharacterized protein LOC106160837 [Lingula anatina]